MGSASEAEGLRPEEAEEICALLGDEERQYRRLRRLAWRQSAYLKRRDARRLEKNAEEWGKYLPAADAARRRREGRLGELAARWGLPPQKLSAHRLFDRARPADGVRLRAAVKRLAETVSELYRQNGLNAMLARFSLELAGEEADLFRRSVLEDPAGRYGDDGRRTVADRGCVVQQRA